MPGWGVRTEAVEEGGIMAEERIEGLITEACHKASIDSVFTKIHCGTIDNTSSNEGENGWIRWVVG